MVTKTKIESEALHEKMNHPDKFVRCPRCGNEIIHIAYPTADEYKCKTDGCIKMSVRGI